MKFYEAVLRCTAKNLLKFDSDLGILRRVSEQKQEMFVKH